jgi:hypothetical protein
MVRPFPPIFLLLAACVCGLVVVPQASAQFGSIFGTDPPRPPSNVPTRPAPDPQFYPPSAQPPAPPPGRFQTQPLPPPPGVNAPAQVRGAPPDARVPTAPAAAPAVPAVPAQPVPAQRARGADPAPPATAAVPQPEEIVTEPPAHKIPNPTAVFAGLDKITGRIISFDVAINETVRFGALEVTPRVCYTRPPTEPSNTDAFVEVDELTLQGELQRIFTGWMFAATPGLNAVEHSIYDVWLTDCKGGSPPVTADAAPPPARAAPPRPAPRAPARTQRRANQQLPPPPLPPR